MEEGGILMDNIVQVCKIQSGMKFLVNNAVMQSMINEKKLHKKFHIDIEKKDNDRYFVTFEDREKYLNRIKSGKKKIESSIDTMEILKMGLTNVEKLETKEQLENLRKGDIVSILWENSVDVTFYNIKVNYCENYNEIILDEENNLSFLTHLFRDGFTDIKEIYLLKKEEN